MRLKNIKLTGFKSFVDPTNVQLTSNMVAVVGPNGCGKSNIIDAVRWVMGESSAKNLRGESMADVIFNGSNARKPVGQASIELVFDNSDGTLKGEYGHFSEISVMRKVTRDGQSQYFINKAKCRRRDITDIFLGTGLGPRSYAIIEQGMISRLIESKPEELRVFVEEAAGISKYKERRRETETRIRHTRENLERLTDLREELDRQLQKLKRQASAAEKYKSFKAEERQLRAQTMALQWQHLRDASSGQREAIANDEIALEASIAEHRGIDARIEQLRESHTEKTDAFNEVQGSYYGIGAEIARLEQSLEHHEQRERQLASDLAETEANAAESAEHLEQDKLKLAEWSEELATIEPEHEQLTELHSASSEALSQAESDMQDWQQRWDDFNAHAAEPQKNAEIQRTRIDQVEESLNGLAGRMQRLQQELAELEAQDFSEKLDGQKQAVRDTEQNLAALQTELEQSSSALVDQRSRHKNSSNSLDAARSELQQARGRLASLEALQKAAQEDSQNNARDWLTSNSLDAAPRILDELKVQPGWEQAVETVLGNNVQAVSVSAIEDIVTSVQQIKDADISFVTSAGTPSVTDNPAVGLPGLSSHIEHGDTAGLLDGVYAARDLPTAISARNKLKAGESIVTQDGIWLGQHWLRVLRGKSGNNGIIERQQQLEGLQEEIAGREQQVRQLIEELDSSSAAIQEAEQDKDRVAQQRAELQSNLGSARAEVKALENSIALNEAGIVKNRAEIHRVEQTQSQQREALTDARAQLDEAIEAMQKVEELRESLLLERDKVRDALAVSRESAQSDRDALQAVAVQAEGLKAKRQSVQETVKRLEKQVLQLNERQQTLKQAAEENSQPIPELRRVLGEQLQTRLEVEASLNKARKAVEFVDHEMREADQNRSQVEQQTQTIRSRLEKARIDSQEMAVRTKTIEEQLTETGFELAAVMAELPEEANLDEWQQSLKEITGKIERLGAINLASIEELKTESERKIYLDAQNEELETALSTLENAIHKIDRETRHLFKETFDKLNESLKDLFPKVFGGGTAYLELTGEDLLDTGIAIMARPPGKRNSTIHLLSGGEKALTAIALVFSIFHLNPAPFCMLDEVDAPLDDANTARYARMISEMSDKVQFIFITHNKITMEMAEHLMGVTMHEAGVSRLVSVDIDEAVELATA